MVDWIAIGSIATIGLVIVGYLQVRAVRSARPSTEDTVKIAPTRPPLINFRIDTGSGSYSFPPDWKVEFLDEKYDKQSNIEIQFKNFSFGILEIRNPNDFTVTRLSLDLRAVIPWSARVESTRRLSKDAVTLLINKNSLRIEVEELPANEKIKIAICGDYISESLSSANAAVDLKEV